MSTVDAADQCKKLWGCFGIAERVGNTFTVGYMQPHTCMFVIKGIGDSYELAFKNAEERRLRNEIRSCK